MGEYVDMFSLLLQEPKPKTRECPWAVQGTKKTMVERNWYNLMCGYTTYAGVVIQKNVARAYAMFKHQDIIHLNHKGSGWAWYNEQFCM